MKLRVTTNSIRLRVGRAEVESLALGGALTERVLLSPAALEVRLEAGGAAVAANFDNGALVVRVPTDEIVAWAMGPGVSIAAVVGGSGGAAVRVLIEKDFDCLHGPKESGADSFPNPRAG